MKYFITFIVVIAVIMSAFSYENYVDGINYISDKLGNLTSAISLLGNSENVENFRQHPLINYKYTSVGMYSTGTNTVPIGMFIANNILPSYLTNNNYNHLYTTEILISPFVYSFSYDGLDNAIKPIITTTKTYNFEQAIRIKLIINVNDGRKYTYDIFMTNYDLNELSVPTFVVSIDNKVFISHRFNDFSEFYEALISNDNVTSNLLNLGYLLNQVPYGDNYVLYKVNETSTKITDVFGFYYDYYTRFNTNK